MNTLIIFLVLLGMGMLLFSSYVLVRNNKVCDFRIKLSDSGAEVLQSFLNSSSYDYDRYKNLSEIWRSILEDTTYNEMLYSFKPLDVEHWLTDEQQEFLKLKF